MSSHKTLLIVDDSSENLKLLGNSLKNAGFNILAALNGKQAIALAESKQPDLILLDVMMPEMNGFEACELLKKNEATVDIPIIFLTASIEPESIKTGFDAGGIDYIAKPFNPDELILRVKNHLKQKKNNENLERELKYKSVLLKYINSAIMDPLSVMLKNTVDLSQTCSSEPTLSKLGEIKSSGEKIKELATHLADLPRLGIHSTKSTLEEFDFSELLHTVAPGTFVTLGSGLRVSVTNTIEEQYYGDKKKLAQALLQIINVQSDQSEKSPITISTHLKERRETFDIIGIEIFVTGTPDNDYLIYDSDSSNREIRLLVARELLRFVDGKITQSTTSHSAPVFSIEVSLTRAAEAKAAMEENMQEELQNAPVFDKKNILIVEDNELNQRLLVSVLQSHGGLISIAQTGKEALEKVLKNNYDLILMDINVPLMDGIEVTKLLRLRYGIVTPIIAISGHSDKISMQKCLDAGMNSFLLKPFEITDLKRIVSMELEKFQARARALEAATVISADISDVEVPRYNLDKINALGNGDTKLIASWMSNFRGLISKGRKEIELILSANEYKSESKIFHELNNYTSYFGVDLLKEYLKDLPKIHKSGQVEELMSHFLLIAEELESIEHYFNDMDKPVKSNTNA